MVPGRKVAIWGKMYRIGSVTNKSTKKNGMNPLKIVPSEISGQELCKTNACNPTGGVIMPNSISFTTITPSQMPSKPKTTIAVKIKGTVSSRLPIASKKQPKIR